MIKRILTAKNLYRVKDARDLERAHRAFVRKQQKAGWPSEVHRGGTVDAYINHGAWVALCECGSGVGVDPELTEARCFGCGAVHRVRFPRERDAIEAELLRRPETATRSWNLGESVDDLRRENAAHGVR